MTLRMGDAIHVTNLPPTLDAYAGYVDGNWPTFPTLRAAYPHKPVLSIAVFAADDADCLDVESGDATNSQAPFWVARQRANGANRPHLYTSLSNAQALIATMNAAGMPRHSYRLWVAHYTNSPHICSPSCGLGFTDVADGTQWTDHGGSYDESLVADDFFDASPPQEETDMLIIDSPSEGIYLLSGSAYIHVMDPNTVNNLTNAGVKTVKVDDGTHQNLVAAHATPGPSGSTGSLKVDGTLQVSSA